MADLTVRRGQGAGGGALAQSDPFQMVRESMRRMQDLFRDPMFELDPVAYLESGRLAQFAPDFEVRETRDGLVFHADLPGVKEEDVDITVVGNRLRISGKREFQQETRGDTWYAAERSYGNFQRTFILPEGCDTNNVDANLENGVLTIRLAKSQAAQPRRISLGGGRQAIEGQYSQGPFHQSQQGQESQQGQNVGQQGGNLGASGPSVAQQNVGQQGQQNVGQRGASGGQQQGQAGGGQGGYGGMYGKTPEAGRPEGFEAAAGGFEHGEQAGGGDVRPGYGADVDKARTKRDSDKE